MKTDRTSPMDVYARNGTNMNQMNDDRSSEHSQTKAAATSTMMRMGSWAMVNVNMANAEPNARNVQPKNSGKVIFTRNCVSFGFFGGEFRRDKQVISNSTQTTSTKH